ncbi:MAG TPA: serine--tRNA ligase [Tepidisphaeraceae bacterium]|nr:serine--tRNA ligase [Tepidisphaeraceae bacterium]
MIDLKDLRENPDRYRTAAQQKRIGVDIDRLLQLENDRRALDGKRQQLTAEKNAIGKQIGQLAGRLKKATGEEQASLQEEMKQLQARPTELKSAEQELDAQVARLEPEIRDLLLRVPQIPDPEVPVGRDDSENVEVRKWGSIRQFEFTPKDHITLGQELGIVDFERGVKLAGTRSYFLLGDGALLHQAVLRFAQDLMIQRGFVPMTVPVLVREQAMTGTGYFPLGREQSYAMSDEEPPVYLVGTAEVSLTAYHTGETLEAHDLPKQYVGMSPCFRREAGTYGKDTAGLYRIHQFDKVEQVIVCRNDVAESKRWHEAILKNAEDVLQALKLPYRVVFVCTGDLGQGQVAKYDIETWMPSRNGFGETHSASRFYDFQARRLDLRYRDDADGKVKFCHTLNNTVAASPRILIPIMELYQNADGSVTIPEVLRPYMGGRERIEKR